MDNGMEKVFVYPAYIRGLGGILLALSVLLWLILGAVALADAASFGLIVCGTSFSAVFAAVSILVIRMASVRVSLSAEGVALIRGRKRRFVPYGDICAVTHTSAIAVSLVLHTDYGRLSIGKNLIAYPEFVERLKARVPAMRPAEGDELRVKCRAWEFYFCAVVFIVPSFAFWVIGLVDYIRGGTGILLLLLCSLILLPFGIALVVALLRYPRWFDFESDRIVLKSLAGSRAFSAADIRRVEYGQKKPRSHSRFGSPVLHFICIEYSGGKKRIQIDQTMSDYPVDGIAEYVRKHYPVDGKFFEVCLDPKIK